MSCFIRKICVSCNNIYAQIPVSQNDMEKMIDNDPDIDWSLEDSNDIVNKQGCCPDCKSESELELHN